MSLAQVQQVIHEYKELLPTIWVRADDPFFTWYQEDTEVVLHCKRLPVPLPGNIGRLTCVANHDEIRFQYDVGKLLGPARYRPVAYRVPFLEYARNHGVEAFKNMTVSHLCHNNWCYNWDHHVLEPLDVNKARNGCPAGPSCRHTHKCLRPGPHSEC